MILVEGNFSACLLLQFQNHLTVGAPLSHPCSQEKAAEGGWPQVLFQRQYTSGDSCPCKRSSSVSFWKERLVSLFLEAYTGMESFLTCSFIQDFTGFRNDCV